MRISGLVKVIIPNKNYLSRLTIANICIMIKMKYVVYLNISLRKIKGCYHGKKIY